MRITRLYCEEKLCCGETIQLNTQTSNHLIRVLRTRIDSPVILFNGDGFDYSCKTLDDNSRKTRISVESKTAINNESNLNITLIQGLSRNDRIETSIQKSVELGVNKIIPVTCQRSNTKAAKEKTIKKLAHWQKIAISACEQSGRCVIPEVSSIVAIDDLDQTLDASALRLTLNPGAINSLSDLTLDPAENDANNDTENRVKKDKPSIQIFIGPEGGLSDEELTLLQTCNFIDICFGPRILRTETAGPAVISALQILWGDFK